jgi:hypothetical protein
MSRALSTGHPAQPISQSRGVPGVVGIVGAGAILAESALTRRSLSSKHF